MNASMKEHWDEIYSALDADELTWYEEKPEASIKLLSRCHINKEDSILDVGAGASTFVDYLIDQGFRNIIATDISEIALNKLRERLGKWARLRAETKYNWSVTAENLLKAYQKAIYCNNNLLKTGGKKTCYSSV